MGATPHIYVWNSQPCLTSALGVIETRLILLVFPVSVNGFELFVCIILCL